MTRTFCVTRKKVDREINSRLIGTLEGFYGFLNWSLSQFKNFRLELLWFHWTSSTANWNQLRIVLRILTMRVMVLCNSLSLSLHLETRNTKSESIRHTLLHTHTRTHTQESLHTPLGNYSEKLDIKTGWRQLEAAFVVAPMLLLLLLLFCCYCCCCI